MALAHVLGGRAVHHDAAAGLELPGALPGVDDEGAAAQARHADLEGGERAQRGIEEQQPEHLAGERARLGLRLQAARELEQRQHLLAGEIGQVEEALHARLRSEQRVAQHVDVLFLEDVGRQQAQDVRIARGAREDAALEQLGLDLPWPAAAVRSPTSSPAPWCAVTGSDDAAARGCRRRCARTRSSSPSDSMASITASMAAQAIGPPPKVVPRASSLSARGDARPTSAAPRTGSRCPAPWRW